MFVCAYVYIEIQQTNSAAEDLKLKNKTEFINVEKREQESPVNPTIQIVNIL